MKIYEALKEMIENKKIIKQAHSDVLYKYQEFEDIEPLLLEKRGEYRAWSTSSIFLHATMITNEWEIYNKKEEDHDSK